MSSLWSHNVLAGRGDISNIEELAAAGWTATAVNDFRATAEHSGFWCGGSCSGSISYPLPAGSARARLTVGMSYDNPACHGIITLGGQSLYDQYHMAEMKTLEFDYTPGDVLTISEEDTCIVDVFALEIQAAAPAAGGGH